MSKDLVEILFTSDSNGAQCTCNAWEPRTSTNLMSYKGGGAANIHGLCMINNKFVITANSTKPLLHVWPINSQDQVPGIRYVVPGKVNCLAVSQDGTFLVAGIQESIYIWEICSGRMLAVLSKHYQNVSTIKFISDGSHFISASQDGSVLVWNLTKTIVQGENNQEPLYSFNDHALPVTDIFVGSGGMSATLCTVSVDRSCRLYDLNSGTMLLIVVLSEKLNCVIMNCLETEVYLGSAEGPIYTFNLHSPPRMKEYHVTNEDCTNKFLGHQGAVTCLAISTIGEMLASGGYDECVHLWHISSRQLLRTLTHHGFITNVSFILNSRSMFNADVRYNFIGKNIKRMMDQSSEESSDVVEILMNEPVEYEIIANKDGIKQCATGRVTSNDSEELEQLRAEVQKLKKINKELFEYTAKCILDRE